jgi:4-hydroxy-4-methyl-2-oxoglutarate aldolase
MYHVHRSFQRPSKADVETVGRFSPATIHEAQGKLGALDYRIKPIQPGLKVCGPAITAQCHIGDNLMIFEAINLAQPGDVLVVSAGNNPNQGGFGDVLAAACIGRGIAGLVVDAGVRDGRGLRAIGFPVFSLGLCMKGTSKDTLGTVNHPIVLGGEIIAPGDIVCGDDDGVVVVREKDIAKLAKACEERDAHENHMMELHREGRMDIEDRYAMMRAKGCVWSD